MASEERKAQLREAQKKYRAKQKGKGKKAQPFLLSEADHANMKLIKDVVDDVKSKESAISYALKETANRLKIKEISKD